MILKKDVLQFPLGFHEFWVNGKTHLYIGEGDLDFKGFFNNLYLDNLHAMTLECNIPYDKNNPNIAVQSMRQARNYLENIIR